MSIQDVAPIFERINSQGTPLTIVDLMRAATWSPEFDLIDSIESILDDLETKGFARVDKKVVLRCLNASTGGGFSADSISDHLRKHTPDVLKHGVEDTREAFKRTVDFLATQIHIPSAEILPYINQLVVLTEIFRQIPKPNSAQYAAINRWFWRTSHSEYFSGWNTGMMSRDMKAVIEFASGNKDIELAASKPSNRVWTDKTFRANNAHSKLLAIVLGNCKPKDMLTGQAIDVSKALAWVNAKEYHHFFPQEFLIKSGVSNSKINCLANIIMLTSASNKTISDKAPSKYLADVIKVAGNNLNHILQSNLIPQSAFDAALKDDFDTFLEIRSEALNEHVAQNACW